MVILHNYHILKTHIQLEYLFARYLHKPLVPTSCFHFLLHAYRDSS